MQMKKMSNIPLPFIENLEKELIEENIFLTKLLDNIPANMYFDTEIRAKITADKHNEMNKTEKNLYQQNLSVKSKHKRSRLNPSAQKSISQIQEELNRKKRKRKLSTIGPCAISASLTRATNVEELQKKFQERFDSLQTKRKAIKDPEGNRKLKKQKNKLKKQKMRKEKHEEGNKDNKVDKATNEKKNNISDSAAVFNKEGNFLYSKFQFTEDGLEEGKKNEYTGKAPKILLKQIEKKKEKLDKLKSVDPQKAQTLEEKEKWKKALQKSEGLKVKDDPVLLKKSAKKEEKKKKKSAQMWKERKENLDKRKKARQEKRSRNIKQKQQKKQDHKIKLAKKKGRVFPGF